MIAGHYALEVGASDIELHADVDGSVSDSDRSMATARLGTDSGLRVTGASLCPSPRDLRNRVFRMPPAIGGATTS